MEINVDSTPSTVTSRSSIANLFLNEINQQDVHGIFYIQNSLLEQLDKTNETLDGINRISANRYLDATREFSNHTQMLTTLKTDLDSIFKRIQLLKTQLNKKYPETFTSVIQMSSHQDDLLDDDDEERSVSHPSLVKSNTVDCSQLSSSIRETYSSAQISNNNHVEQSPSSFDTVRRFVFDKSSDGQGLTTIFKNARDELRKINDGLLGGNNHKSSTSKEE